MPLKSCDKSLSASSSTSILHCDIFATSLSMRSRIRPGVAIMSWTVCVVMMRQIERNNKEIYQKLVRDCNSWPKKIIFFSNVCQWRFFSFIIKCWGIRENSSFYLEKVTCIFCLFECAYLSDKSA